MTQPLYAIAQVEAMLAEARRRFGPRGFPVPVLLGVLPLVSARHAEFLHNEVPGIVIPDEARAAMHAAGERGSEVGIEMADALLTAVEADVAGTYIMPSFGRYEQAPGSSGASANVTRPGSAREPCGAAAERRDRSDGPRAGRGERRDRSRERRDRSDERRDRSDERRDGSGAAWPARPARA